MKVRRIGTAAAVLALVASAPGLVGVAQADDLTTSNSPGRHSANDNRGGDLFSGLTAEQKQQVQAARTTYRDAVQTARSKFKLALSGVVSAAQETLKPLREQARTAHQAYEDAVDSGVGVDAARAADEAARKAYRDAVANLRTTYGATIDSAVSQAKAEIAAARDAFIAQVKVIAPSLASANFAGGMPGLNGKWDHGVLHLLDASVFDDHSGGGHHGNR